LGASSAIADLYVHEGTNSLKIDPKIDN